MVCRKAHRFKEYQPYKGEIERRVNGSMIALETGNSFAYAIDKLQDRGKFFIDPGEDVYMGEVVGDTNSMAMLSIHLALFFLIVRMFLGLLL